MIRYLLIVTAAALLMAGCGIYAAHEPAGEPGGGKNSAVSPAGQAKESKAPKK